MKGRVNVARKREKTASISRSLFTVFLAILCVSVVLGMIVLTNRVIIIRNELDSINSMLTNVAPKQSASTYEEDYYLMYIKLSEKAQQDMDRLVSTVGILATVYTIFGALIVFKAPHEIDKRIDKMDSLISDANNSAMEATYQAAIIDAMVNGYNGKMTNYERIRRLTQVIDRFPDKPDAYMQRGFIYDEMERYNEAIADYKSAFSRGADKSSYYNAMGVAYNKKEEYKKAISLYTKAIKSAKEDASQYVNRGSCYDDMGEFEKALDDYNKAIELDDGCKEAYINRSITYKKQRENESDDNRKDKLNNLIISDLQKALELDPDDVKTRHLLRNSITPALNPDEMLAKIDERIGDLEYERKSFFSAFKQYVESCNYYLLKHIRDGENRMVEIERLISKIYTIQEDEIVSDLPKIPNELSFFCQGVRGISVQFYIEGKKEAAEKSFLVLSRYDRNDKGYILNLSFMKRRKETNIVTSPVSDLLAQYDKPSDAIWCTNKALCYVSGVDNHEISWEKAIEVMNASSENMDDAVSWWEHTEIVGDPEHNMAMILFKMSEKFSVQDDVPLPQRINIARNDGYSIPSDIQIN